MQPMNSSSTNARPCSCRAWTAEAASRARRKQTPPPDATQVATPNYRRASSKQHNLTISFGVLDRLVMTLKKQALPKFLWKSESNLGETLFGCNKHNMAFMLVHFVFDLEMI